MSSEEREVYKRAFIVFLKKKKVYSRYMEEFDNGYRFRCVYATSAKGLDRFMNKMNPSEWISSAFSWRDSPVMWRDYSDNWEDLYTMKRNNLGRSNIFSSKLRRLYASIFVVELNENTRVI